MFFSDETILLDRFTHFVAAALKSDNAAIAVVTKSHRQSLRRRLKADGVDIDHAIQQGIFILLDVADTLAALLVDGSPDPVRFLEDFSRLIDKASKAAKAEHPRVSFCGECIGNLWAEGETDAALRLEQGCNDLAKTHEVDLLCAARFGLGGLSLSLLSAIDSIAIVPFTIRMRSRMLVRPRPSPCAASTLKPLPKSLTIRC